MVSRLVWLTRSARSVVSTVLAVANVLAILLVPAPARAEEAPNLAWFQHLGADLNDRVHGLAADATGTYATGTLHTDPGLGFSGEPFVRKYDAQGSIAWDDFFGTDLNRQGGLDRPTGTAAAGGSVYVAGQITGRISDASGTRLTADAFLRKYDGSGNVVWHTQFGTINPSTGDGDSASGVAADAGGVYIAGMTADALPGISTDDANDLGSTGGAFVRKYDHDGRILWTRQFRYAGFHFGVSGITGVAADATGVYVAGSYSTTCGGFFCFAYFVRKYDPNGNYDPSRGVGWTAGLGADVFPTGIAAGGAGVYVSRQLGFYSGSTCAGGTVALGDNGGILRLNAANGSAVWDRWSEFPNRIKSYLGVAAGADGSYVIGYTRDDTTGVCTPFVRKYGPNGTEGPLGDGVLWTKLLDTGGGTEGSKVAVDSSGVVYAGGRCRYPAFVAKLGSGSGTINACAPTAPPPSGNRAPSPSIGGAGRIPEGGSATTPVSLTASASDPDGDQVTFRWDLDNDGVYEKIGQTATLTVDAQDGPRTYTVGLKACDDKGACATASAAVEVDNVAPQATFTAPTEVAAGSPIALSLTNPSDPSPADAAAGFSYAFNCGDGRGFLPQPLGTTNTASCPTAVEERNTVRTVAGMIVDKDGGTREYAAQVQVGNQRPTANAGRPIIVPEGGSPVTLAGSGSDPDGDPLTYAWDLDNDGSFETPGQTATLAGIGADGPDTRTAVLRVCDAKGACATSITTVTITNVAPTATFNAVNSVDEGSVFVLSLTDPSDPSPADMANGFHYAFGCDATVDLATYANGSGLAPSQTCAFPDGPGARTLRSRIIDKDDGYSEYAAEVTVRNVPPSVRPPVVSVPSGGGQAKEGEAITASAVFSDPNPDDGPFTCTVDYGDGSGPLAGTVNGTTCTGPARTYADNGSYVVTIAVRDKDGGVGTNSLTHTVANVAPIAGAITGPADPVQVNTSISTSATFTDAGVLDTHTGVWDWGDGTSSAGTITEANGSGSASGGHSYMAAGVYVVTLTVTDKDGGAGQAVLQYIVVYDPNGGSVTGRGRINSPAGACQLTAACATASGMASFGFVSRYQPGATVPTGQTAFRFTDGNLDFQSASYDWLVVSGARAQYKGTGTISRTGTYGFLLTAIDGQLDGTGTDRFRIKIWDKTTDQIVYDNQMGAADTDSPTTAIASGNIIITPPTGKAAR